MRPCDEEVKSKLKCRRQLSSSSSHHTLLSCSDSVRSTVVFHESVDLDALSVLYAANEMLKNLNDMATDSFRFRAATIGQTDGASLQSLMQHNATVPHIYHPGAMTALVDLLPAVNETCGRDEELDAEVCQV